MMRQVIKKYYKGPILPAGKGPPSGSVPSWFMFGELDRNTPVELHRFMAVRADSRRTAEVPGASHVVGISHSEELVRLLLEASESVGAVTAHTGS